jgi:KRAB domain-containing zinc finger protein
MESRLKNEWITFFLHCIISASLFRRIATFHCRVCNEGFIHRKDLKTHSRTHTGWMNYTKVHLCHKSHLLDHSYCITGSKTQFCHLCNKEFTKLQDHYRTHTGEKPYKCEKCGRQFSLRGSLKRHFTVHTGEKRHQCNVCFKWLSTKRSLRNHILLHENRLHECHVCHVKFSRLKTLNIHSRLQCGEKQCNTNSHSVQNKLPSLRKKRVRCEICLKKFSNKGNLFQHYRVHKKEPCNLKPVNPLKCDVCSKQFLSASTLKRHSHMHTWRILCHTTFFST